MAVNHGPARRAPRARPPLGESELEQLALNYAGRYATTRARLAAYLQRKLRERGWAGDREAPVEALVSRMSDLGYVNDRMFAAARAASLDRRGYGERRVRDVLRAAGISDEDKEAAVVTSRRAQFDAALRFAERRRIGPFATREGDRKAEEKAVGALIRAGHSHDLARRLARCRPGQVPELDDD